MPKLFTYGTLQLPKVQKALFGRLLKGTKDKLASYVLEEVVLDDKQVITLSGKKIHVILKHTGNPSDFVDGIVFELTEKEIIEADSYEPDDYERVELTFVSGQKAFAYIAS